MDPNSADQKIVSAFRDEVSSLWSNVDAVDCVRFVGQELFELDTVLMRLGYQSAEYARNARDPENLESAKRLELGQLYMMVLSLGTVLGCNLSDCLAEALEYQRGKIYTKLLERGILGTLSPEQEKLLRRLELAIANGGLAPEVQGKNRQRYGCSQCAMYSYPNEGCKTAYQGERCPFLEDIE